MANYTFNEKINNPATLWNKIQSGLANDVIIKSIQDKIHYNVKIIDNEKLSFTADTRKSGKPEIISKLDFTKVINELKTMDLFNTSSSRHIFKETKIYKKRSPMFALLLSAGVIRSV